MVLFGKPAFSLFCLCVWNSCSNMSGTCKGAKGSEIIALLDYSKSCSWSARVRLLLCSCCGHSWVQLPASQVPECFLLKVWLHTPLHVGNVALLTSWPAPFVHLLLLLTEQAFLHLLVLVNPACIKVLHHDLLVLAWCGFSGCCFFTFLFLLIVILVCALQFVFLKLRFQKLGKGLTGSQ